MWIDDDYDTPHEDVIHSLNTDEEYRNDDSVDAFDNDIIRKKVSTNWQDE